MLLTSRIVCDWLDTDEQLSLPLCCEGALNPYRHSARTEEHGRVFVYRQGQLSLTVGTCTQTDNHI